MPPSDRKAFVNTLRRIAEENGLTFTSASHDWIIQLGDGKGRVCNVFGYTFDVNPAAAVDICREKAATSSVLDMHSVPNISHHVYLNPAHEMTCDYVPRKGSWTSIQKLVEEVNFPIVLKPLKGTGGLDVFKATCEREVEAAVQHIFAREYGIAISPYKRIIDEYRCFCLDGTVELMYKKLRRTVSGDGTSSVATLVANLMSIDAAKPGIQGKQLSGLAKAIAAMSPEELIRVPQAGEQVPVQWKHNLGQGAFASLEVTPTARTALEALAPRAAAAVGLRFGSVDIVEVQDQGFMIMEINSGVMMDSLISQLGEEGAGLAKRLYGSAVLKALSR